jgi:hypothetical protein
MCHPHSKRVAGDWRDPCFPGRGEAILASGIRATRGPNDK